MIFLSTPTLPVKFDWEEYRRERMDNDQWWRDRYREIENHGYRLDDQYDPDPEVGLFELMSPSYLVSAVY